MMDGVFSEAPTTPECGDMFTLGTGGPGGRNFLEILNAPSGADHIRNHATMGNPSTMYVRFWFRQHFAANSMHVFWINNTIDVDLGFNMFRGYTSGKFSIIPNNGGGGVGDYTYYYTGTLTDNQWYRLEYKITGGGGSNGTILVRLDGVDITSSMEEDSTSPAHPLTYYNGSLTLPQMNQVVISSYDKYTPVGADWLDIAGLKITDGPDWIGGDGDATPSGLYTRGNYSSLPTTDDALGTEYSGTDITNVLTSDDVWVSQTAFNQYMVHQYKLYAGNHNRVTVKWEGKATKAPSVSTVYLQIYNQTSSTWETIDSDSTTAANTDFTMSKTITDLADYKDGSNYISTRVYQFAN
jgi:hypothetical protein